ncbi:hypothetical protein CFC21_101751 [Triticum aestivum]|uniref:Uncharacterized protein n=2 Tax=Triticum aestivum TaxID=4565 RepID=A0A3B6U3W0_WHEAT|nr:hypothetical protein CFC21_101751 [Triticum aestivum]
MKAGREDTAVEKDAAVEAVEKPAVVIVAAVGVADGTVAVTGGGAPSAVTAPAAVTASEPVIGEQVEEEVAVDLEEQRAKRKREQYELIDKYYEEAELDTKEVQDEAVEFDEEVDDELSEEDDEDVDDSKERRDIKSRYVLRRLRNGEIPYRSGSDRLYGNIACPFSCARIKSDYDNLIMHGTDISRGNGRDCKPHGRAEHAAFGAFLGKYAKGIFHSTSRGLLVRPRCRGSDALLGCYYWPTLVKTVFMLWLSCDTSAPPYCLNICAGLSFGLRVFNMLCLSVW